LAEHVILYFCKAAYNPTLGVVLTVSSVLLNHWMLEAHCS